MEEDESQALNVRMLGHIALPHEIEPVLAAARRKRFDPGKRAVRHGRC